MLESRFSHNSRSSEPLIFHSETEKFRKRQWPGLAAAQWLEHVRSIHKVLGSTPSAKRIKGRGHGLHKVTEKGVLKDIGENSTC